MGPHLTSLAEASPLWLGIIHCWEALKMGIYWIKDGQANLFWTNQWVDDIGCLELFASQAFSDIEKLAVFKDGQGITRDLTLLVVALAKSIDAALVTLARRLGLLRKRNCILHRGGHMRIRSRRIPMDLSSLRSKRFNSRAQ
ncbi:hypothetical protein Ancab_031354 [Ancistrocladus abbreviatus]